MIETYQSRVQKYILFLGLCKLKKVMSQSS
jgi:hypothetical protein